MGKNYTLYIAHDDFANEPNKSGLINDLLATRYIKPTKSAINPFACKKCGQIKVAGKCVTKGCNGL